MSCSSPRCPSRPREARAPGPIRSNAPARRPGPVGRRGGRRARRGAAATYGLLTAPHATAEADRALLRRCALALLAHPADVDLHGAALTLLVRDPQTRDRYLPQALRVFVQGDPHLSAAELVVALPTRREPVIAAFREALTRPGDGAGEVLRSLAAVDAPTPALHAPGPVRAYVDSHPEGGAHVAEYIDRRMEHGCAAGVGGRRRPRCAAVRGDPVHRDDDADAGPGPGAWQS
ncbi:hypothetical protein [Streptomyces sp. NPDC005498]|uniref:hypothetical protein n=1 Tax=Streptomyces sp. NPDC005498 TaxID=3364717 RepID=UPI0036B83F8C